MLEIVEKENQFYGKFDENPFSNQTIFILSFFLFIHFLFHDVNSYFKKYSPDKEDNLLKNSAILEFFNSNFQIIFVIIKCFS